ncbi:MAG: ATP-dependent DNA helicase RecG [Bacteroidales bacterium]|jgi:ATP-dependent DNA helicase RecG|nr:ATP-dependent DNA helicase RecG [Bacteroidales bacterium]
MDTLTYLATPIEYLKGVGPRRSDILKNEFNIFTFNDLLHYYPFRHVDKSTVYQIADIQTEGVYMQFKGKIVSFQILGEHRAKRLAAKFTDGTGTLDLVWFNGIKWVEDTLKQQSSFIVFGRLTAFNNRWNISHPELIDPQNRTENAIAQHFYPLYNTSEKAKKAGLDSKAIAKLTASLLTQLHGEMPEILSTNIISQHHLISLKSALFAIHYPENQEQLAQAQHRLKFDELFFTQLKLLKLKLLVTKKNKGHVFARVGDFFNDFYHRCLTFDLTNAQKRVIREIRRDMSSGQQMNRLLQGDVGSGKTITALLVMLIAKDNGFQSCLMAPTEILAAQHFENISKQLSTMNVTVAILTGSTKTAQRKQIHQRLQNGEIDILIGTHALIENDVIFNNLGLAVIDEQHRFGVEQRAKLWEKNIIPPHILVMTATPIPRTLAMTVYGDLELSVIDELPKGRKPVITKHLYEKDRLMLFGFIKKQIDIGRQIFVVYPLIKESEKMDLLDLQAGFDNMSRAFPLPQYAIGMVHGKMKNEVKDFEMQRFAKNQTSILLSTTVIEVGIDIPNATVMIIENAERFGLSQLHQLRGRVGRGGEQSYCILMSGDKLSNEGKQRLQAMVATTDGFEIANFDLKLRGPGDLQGTQQSGIIDFKIADIIKDEQLVVYTRNLAKKLLEADPDLKATENQSIAKQLQLLIRQDNFWGMIS